MSTGTITSRTAVTAGNLTDAAVVPVDDANGNTRKATLAQLRTQLNTGAQAYAPSTAGAAATKNKITKSVASIANNTATDVLTVTIPNAAHTAMVRVTLVGSLGAGGAIGANEATGTISYDIAIARTAGVNAVAAISSAYGSQTAAVAGAATITVTGTLGSISGAVGAVNTFTVKVTIARGSGSSSNHTCTVYAEVLNGNATGVTIA